MSVNATHTTTCATALLLPPPLRIVILHTLYMTPNNGGAVGFVIGFGGVCYRIRILMYPDVSCVYPEGYTYPESVSLDACARVRLRVRRTPLTSNVYVS